MNKVQKKAFQLLYQFDRICKELGLSYFLVCGSALGAVKYGGFIPWDDDIDVAMFRDEYEIFCEKAPLKISSQCFLQNYRTEPVFPAIYSKLRDSSTTCMEESVASLPINHGICIDIFPLDGYPSDRQEQILLEVKKRFYMRMLSVSCVRPEFWKEMILKPFRILGFGKNTATIAARYTECISAWSVRSSKNVANHGNWQGKLDYHEAEVYGEGFEIKFEGLPVLVPFQYDKYLMQKYGNYYRDPPKEMQRSHHRYLHLDPDHPYSDYLEKKTKRGVAKNAYSKKK